MNVEQLQEKITHYYELDAVGRLSSEDVDDWKAAELELELYESGVVDKVFDKAQEVIYFDELKYLETKEFNNDGHSVYHVFGAFNSKLGVWQSVTYSPTDNSIEIRVHAMCVNFETSKELDSHE